MSAELVVRGWSRRFADTGAVMGILARSLGAETIGLVAEGFRAEKDPYGSKWKKKKRPDGRKVLHGRTAGLRNGWHLFHSDRRGWGVRPAVRYAVYHQSSKPRKRLPRRMMVPDTKRGLPASWVARYREAAQETLLAAFGTKLTQSGRNRLVSVAVRRPRFST